MDKKAVIRTSLSNILNW